MFWETKAWLSCIRRQYGSYGKSLHGFKEKKKTDAYTPGGVIGKRPDHATVVYCNLIKII